MTPEHDRLAHAGEWRRWGPYLSERAWGTVREDYSPDGSAWEAFPHDHARSRVYRWNEDGLGGICDDQQRLCFAWAFWNGRDPILKERLFGLNGPEGNHGEDVKERYFYIDSTPTHSWMRMLYVYPQAAFPYADLVAANRRRGYSEPEYELDDTGVFDGQRYFELFVEYAKAGPHDLLIRLRAINCGPEQADLHVLPTLWFRNTWSWGTTRISEAETQAHPLSAGPGGLPAHHARPQLRALGPRTILAEHSSLGHYLLSCEAMAGRTDQTPTLLFTENETNAQRLFGAPNRAPYVKDGINDRVVQGRVEAVSPQQSGTKAAAWYQLSLQPGEEIQVRLRLTRVHSHTEPQNHRTTEPRTEEPEPHNLGEDSPATSYRLPPIVAEHGEAASHQPFSDFDALFAQRQREADAFYGALQPAGLSDDLRQIQRQAFAGMLWSKQFYHYDVDLWLEGDPGQPAPPPERAAGRNREWRHFNTAHVISMPDKWEYPWFAAWDLAFHCIPLTLVDPEFAEDQLILLGREWYQHPNGQIPAYEWNFGDVNPPVLAWAAWRMYKIEQKHWGRTNREFLERVFHKLMLSFTWWVNRKDAEGKNIFQGGFLGLDNIGVFDRSAPLPGGGHIEQSDGTSWMGMFCLNMLTISLELACHNRVYEDIATKFFEHFLYIAEAMNNIAGESIALWDEGDKFFYDVLHLEGGQHLAIKIRSMVGLIPLYAVTTIEPALLAQLPEFRERLEWFLEHRPHLAGLVSRWEEPGLGERRLLALCRGHRMKRLLRRMLDEREFLSPYGIRSLSRIHAEQPYQLELNGARYQVRYLPAESDSGLFGGNSNWRGPIWFPVNYLLIEALQQYHHYYGDDFLVECPTGSGQMLTLRQIADELARRLISIFQLGEGGRRPSQPDGRWSEHLLFHEYFHGDSGAGLGASHQTGWTGLVAKLIQQHG